MRDIVKRPDGRRIRVARIMGQLFVCADGCCCGRVQDGYLPVPRELYHQEWERRRLRNHVHLTIGGCLGPCALGRAGVTLCRNYPGGILQRPWEQPGRGS